MDSMAVHWRNLHHIDLCHNSKDQSIALVPVNHGAGTCTTDVCRLSSMSHGFVRVLARSSLEVNFPSLEDIPKLSSPRMRSPETRDEIEFASCLMIGIWLPRKHGLGPTFCHSLESS